jgi:hypothetical protein
MLRCIRVSISHTSLLILHALFTIGVFNFIFKKRKIMVDGACQPNEDVREIDVRMQSNISLYHIIYLQIIALSLQE